MAQNLDWSWEREQAVIAFERIKEQLMNVGPNESHPECDCGDSLLVHICNSLQAVENFIALCDGNMEPFVKEMKKLGPVYPIFMVGQIFPHEEIGRILTKIKNSLIARSSFPDPFSPFNPGGMFN